MKYTEHKELAERLHAEAMEALRRSSSHEYAFEGMDEFDEYVRLDRLANKHYGVYRMVRTQMRDRAERKRRAELDAWPAQE